MRAGHVLPRMWVLAKGGIQQMSPQRDIFFFLCVCVCRWSQKYGERHQFSGSGYNCLRQTWVNRAPVHGSVAREGAPGEMLTWIRAEQGQQWIPWFRSGMTAAGSPAPLVLERRRNRRSRGVMSPGYERAFTARFFLNLRDGAGDPLFRYTQFISVLMVSPNGVNVYPYIAHSIFFFFNLIRTTVLLLVLSLGERAFGKVVKKLHKKNRERGDEIPSLWAREPRTVDD